MSDLRDRRCFCRVAELESFSAAGRDLGVPVATVSAGVRRLEDALGLRLLERTTRRVSLTEAGRGYYAAVAPILDDLADAEARALSGAEAVAGRVRIAAPANVGTGLLVPHLVEFTHAHPGLDLDFALGDRVVNLVGESVDVALRIGPLPDRALSARKLGAFEQVVCAAPSWVESHGPVDHPEQLTADLAVAYRFPGIATGYPWELSRGEEAVSVLPRAPVTFDDLDAYVEAGCAGLGPICVLSFQAARHVERGALVRLLPDWCGAEIDLHAVTVEKRHRPQRVEAVLAWVADCAKR